MKSTIRLFKSLPIETKEKKSDDKLMEKTLPMGFVFAPEVIANYSDYNSLIKIVEEVYGMTAEKMNSSFHKSWKKIKEADIEQLVMEQIIHYMTTYGFESMGFYDASSVYIPREELNIPELKEESIHIVVIKGYTKDELKEKLIKLLESGIALKEETKDDVLDIATYVEISKEEVSNIKNKEVRIALYDYFNIVPSDPLEFLRYLVYKATNETLLIKNSDLIGKIKEKDNLSIVRLFSDYAKEYELTRLSEIFYRFKPIFLAFRTNKSLKVTINKIRRLAEKNHKPLLEDYLNNVTALLKVGKQLDKNRLTHELDKVNIFRKIRLAYALKYRTKDVDSILYRIRNGKSYATDFQFKHSESAKETLDVVIESIVKSIKKNVDKKKIFIPSYINYALPSTEKQYTGDFPSGTYITVPKDMIVGVNWKDIKSNRIDLDLSLISHSGKIGWDSSYRTHERDVLFSGDITEAHGKDGATELFYIKNQVDNEFILFLNYFNYDKEIEVPFKILVASEDAEDFGSDYMVDPNNLITALESKINKKQMILGLLTVTPEETRFYFAETSSGSAISSRNSKLAETSRSYLFNFYKDSIYLKEILAEAGAEFVEDKIEADIDLSPESIERDSILKLLS